ncbi:radical SAM protein [Halosegnis sp.]|uniref:radical SAM protein n=1 Tax=Halosegnis sp. TaxID=2864959 RepID=UPI0035D3E34B
MSGDALATTTSLCPTCLERCPGHYERRSGSVYLTRECPDHGTASRKVWGSVEHWNWAGELGPEFTSEIGADEPLSVDNDHACLAVVEVTTDCNLSCSFCFASSGPGGDHLPREAVRDRLRTVKAGGGPRPVQFSGGEPTVRDDLPELVADAREMGFDHVQVNTNGIRLAEEDDYAQTLADAGVTAIYLQFDGLSADTHEAIREVDLTGTKTAALEACRDAGLSVVLVPTVVPDVNDDEMDEIVEFALEHVDVIESVNFQPVAHMGRYEEHDGRYALDDAARALASQVDALAPRDLLPIPCCSSYCQMATVLQPADGDDSDPLPLTGLIDDEAFASLSGVVDEADWMELLANTKTGGSRACSAAGCCGLDLPDGSEALLDSVLPISLTGFMDADAADVERLDNCCISVPTADGDLVPFCAYNMTTDDGDYALRNRNDWGGRTAVDAPLPEPPDASEQAREPPAETDGGREGSASECGPDCCGGEGR